MTPQPSTVLFVIPASLPPSRSHHVGWCVSGTLATAEQRVAAAPRESRLRRRHPGGTTARVRTASLYVVRASCSITIGPLPHVAILIERDAVSQNGPRLEVEWLPPCASELNPTEHVWGHTKNDDLANFIPDDVFHLGRKVASRLRKTRVDPPLQRSFFKTSKLSLSSVSRFFKAQEKAQPYTQERSLSQRGDHVFGDCGSTTMNDFRRSRSRLSRSRECAPSGSA